MYGKFFSSTFTGSMIGAGPVVFAVWGYIIANAVKGHVELNPQLLAAIIGADVNDIEAAVKYLEAPDPRSRSKDLDGRRIVKVGQFLYSVTNFQQYHNMRNEDDRREYNRVKQAEHRAKLKAKLDADASKRQSLTNKQSKPNHTHTYLTDTDTDTDTDTETATATTTDTHTANSQIQNPVQQPLPLPSPAQPPTADQQPKRKAGRPTKAPKTNAARFPALNPVTLKHDDSLPKVNAWTVWIDVLRDRGIPTPLPDPQDTKASKPLNSVETRLELEWIYSDYIQDDDDKWLEANFPKAGQRLLRFLSSRVAKYRVNIEKARNKDGKLPTYTYGTFKKPGAKPEISDDDRDPADIFLEKIDADAEAEANAKTEVPV